MQETLTEKIVAGVSFALCFYGLIFFLMIIQGLIMNSLKKHLIENYSHNELADCANHGCQGGFGDFIYYSDTVRYFEQFKDDCFEIIQEYNEAMGLGFGFPEYVNRNMDTYTTFANSMIWFAVEWLAYEITQGEYIEESEAENA